MSLAVRSLGAFRAAARIAPRTTFARALSTYPSDRRYLKSHEWAKMDGDEVTVGISDHAQAALGDVVHVELPDMGTKVEAGSEASSISSVKASSEIYAPVTGEVVAVNEALESEPEIVNTSPHDDGWMFKIKVANASEYDGLLDSAAYGKLIEESD